MPSPLEDALLKRLPSPIGTPIPLPTEDPTPPSLAKTVFNGGIEGIMGMLGIGPETKANQVGQLAAASLPIFRIGGKLMKNVGGVWKILDDAEQTTLTNRIAPKDPVQRISSFDDLHNVMPPVRTKEAPPISGKYGAGGIGAARAKSKLNESMVMDIRKRGLSEHPEKIAEDYGVSTGTVRDIISRNSFSWVK